MMHVRSKFEAAMKAGELRAAIAMHLFKAIYVIEAECKSERLSPEARKARRDERSRPKLAELKTWIDTVHPRTVPKSPLYVATTYAINQWNRILRCFDDGRFEIDNHWAEQQLRIIALGRKKLDVCGQ